MTLSEISIRNPVFAWMLMIGLIFFGTIGFQRMGVSQMPDVDFPVVTVSMTLEGAAPEVVETEIVDVLEDAVLTIEGVRSVTSSAQQGSGSVSVEFELDRNIDVALQEVQTKISQARRLLPDEADPPVVTKSNPEDMPILWLGLSGEGKSIRELVDYADDQLKHRLQTVSGVGEVLLGGFLERNLRVWVDAKKLSSREMTVTDLVDTIETQHKETPAGRIETSSREFNVRVMGEASGVDAFGNLRITRAGGMPLHRSFRLNEVARIEDGVADVRRLARVNGNPAIGLGIKKQRGSNAVAVARGVLERVKEIQGILPPGYHLDVNFDSTRFIEESVAELNFTLLLSALLTSLVCYLFLGSWSSTLNVLLAIPTSIVGSFLFLYFFGFTLNTFTLLGLALAVGIVVDDAIMVLENIMRHREGGMRRKEAARTGANEIGFAAIAATLAVIAVFLPVAFMKGVIGKFFFQFGVTISIAVALSLLEALTLTPMRCSQFLEAGKTDRGLRGLTFRIFEGLRVGYRAILAVCLRFRWLVLAGSVALFAVSLLAWKHLRKEFVPAQDQSMFMIRLQAPIGSSIDFTNERFLRAEALLRKKPELRRYFSSIGGFGGGEVDTGIMFITLKPPEERKRTQEEMMDSVRQEFNGIDGLRAIVQDLSTRGLTAERGFPVEFSIRGPDWEKLASLSTEIQKKMEEAGAFEDIDTDYRVGMPEVRVVPDRDRAAERGVSVAALAQTIQAAIGGVRAGEYTSGSRKYDIRLRLEASDRDRPEAIRSLLVRNDRGEVIPLRDVTRTDVRTTVQTLKRRDRERSIGVFANLKRGVSQAHALDTARQIAEKILPEGYRVVFTGGAKTFQESFASLFFALYIGIAVAYMVLASQFNSFLHPFTILLALPFSISGGLLGLLLTGRSLNIFSFIGLLLLLGLVKKNSILLVDFTNQSRARGMKPREALLEACPTRLRPVLMTSISTIVAAIPPALALGPGAETRIPMAITVIGGMVVSTLLTLFVVPCAYEVLLPLERIKPTDSSTDASVS